LQAEPCSQPVVRFLGSGDFHHVSLALVRRLEQPFNLVVLDKHPDWMRFVPFLHCGTWLHHAAQLPQVEHVFHIGGDLDFDNAYQALAPWPLLRSGKITVFPAVRRFERGRWSNLPHEPLRVERGTPVTVERIREFLEPLQDQLASRPLYISLDKDVMTADEAVVNWDSGHLTLAEVQIILKCLLNLAGGRLAGFDVVGDWSPVCVQGGLRRTMHFIMHPALAIDPAEAPLRNQEANLALLEDLRVGVQALAG
jgi:arginase family enzyme